MSEKRAEVLAALAGAGISYELVDHPAVYTMEEMEALHLPHGEAVVKNLFLRDPKGRRFFLVSLRGDKRADLRALGEQLGVKLSFASEERLMEQLGLEKGSVTPFGVLNGGSGTVEVLFDEDIRAMPLIGVHPNENTATVFLAPAHLAGLIRDHGNPFEWVKIG